MASVRHIGLFPWCLNEAEEDSARIVLSKTLAIAAWWRVKSWKFSINYSGSVLTEAGLFDHGSLSDFFIVQRGQYINDGFEENSGFAGTEKDLVCDTDGLSETIYTGFGSSPSGSYRYDFEILIGDQPVQKIGNDFSFHCRFIMNPVLTLASIGSDITSGPNLTNIGTFTFSILGEDFTKPINLIRSTSLSGVNYSCDASIEAYKYFEYDPDDGGGPIYNENTGDQLRPFP